MSLPDNKPPFGPNNHDYMRDEESNELSVIDYGNEFSRARFMNNQAERSIQDAAWKQGLISEMVGIKVKAGELSREKLIKVEQERLQLAIGIFNYAEIKERYPFIDTKSSSDLGTNFANLSFVNIVDEDMDKLAHEVELGNSITPLGQEQRAAAYGFLEQHPDIGKLTLEDFQDINGALAPCVIPNIASAITLKVIAEALGYTKEVGTAYKVRRRTDFVAAVQRAMQRNLEIEEYVQSGEISPKVAVALGHAMQEFSCIRPKVTTRTRAAATDYSPTEIIHTFFKKGGLYVTQGLPLLHIADDQNKIAYKFFDPRMYTHSSTDMVIPQAARMESLNGVLAPCVIANLITGVRLVKQGTDMLK